MVRADFIKFMETYNLQDRIILTADNYVRQPMIFGVFHNGSKWVAYETNKRCWRRTLIATHNEEYALQYLYEYLISIPETKQILNRK